MTIADYRIDANHHVAVITWPAVEPAIEDWTATLDAIFGDPSFKPTFGILSDRRRGTSRPPRAGYVTAVRNWMTAGRASGRFVGRVATLAVSADPMVFGMWLALESLPGDGYEYQVFTDLATALDWLNEVEPEHTSDGRRDERSAHVHGFRAAADTPADAGTVLGDRAEG